MTEALRRRSPSEEAAWHEGYAYGLKMAARVPDTDLEGYWERAYWRLVPKLIDALRAATRPAEAYDHAMTQSVIDAPAPAGLDVEIERLRGLLRALWDAEADDNFIVSDFFESGDPLYDDIEAALAATRPAEDAGERP